MNPLEQIAITPGGGDTGTPRNLQKRLARIVKQIDINEKRILDCGCGAGQFVRSLNQHGAIAWGIEYSEAKVAEYKQFDELPERVSVGNLEQMDIATSSFDVALVNEVLEHVENPAKALKEIHRILTAEGILIMFAPNRLYPFETHGVYLKDSEYMLPHYVPFIPYIPLGIGARLFTYRARNYWPSDLRRLCAQCGFKVVDTDYVWQTFENISRNQPRLISIAAQFLRRLSDLFERTPLVRMFGASQFVVAEKVS